MIMMKKLSRKSFIEAATCTAAKGREERFKRWGKRRIHGIFLLSSRLQHRVLVHFFQVLLTWLNPLKLNTFFCSLQWVEKVTAQMIPSSSPLVKFWHGSLFVTSTVCMYDRAPWPMHPLAFFIFAEKQRCENDWSTTPRFISFPLRAFWSMILWRKRPERKDEVHEFPVWNVHEAHGLSTAVGRNAPSRTQTIILQVVYWTTALLGPGFRRPWSPDISPVAVLKSKINVFLLEFCQQRFAGLQMAISGYATRGPWTNQRLSFSCPTKMWTYRSDEKTAQPRLGSNLGLPIAGGTL